jgi:serine/threonine protein kinase
MDNYHVLEIIGEGSFGKVYKGRKKFSSQVRLIVTFYLTFIYTLFRWTTQLYCNKLRMYLIYFVKTISQTVSVFVQIVKAMYLTL